MHASFDIPGLDGVRGRSSSGINVGGCLASFIRCLSQTLISFGSQNSRRPLRLGLCAPACPQVLECFTRTNVSIKGRLLASTCACMSAAKACGSAENRCSCPRPVQHQQSTKSQTTRRLGRFPRSAQMCTVFSTQVSPSGPRKSKLAPTRTSLHCFRSVEMRFKY